MPSFSNYGKYLGMNGHTLGEVRKDQGKDILEWTWDGDPSQQIAYQFDMYHDPDPYALDDVKPTKNMVPKLTNCKNCGAPLHSNRCEFCDTEYDW